MEVLYKCQNNGKIVKEGHGGTRFGGGKDRL